MYIKWSSIINASLGFAKKYMKNYTNSTRIISTQYLTKTFNNSRNGRNFIKFSVIASCASGLSSNWYCNTIEEEVENNLAHLMILAKIALESGDVERAEALLHVGLNLAEDHQLYIGVPLIYDILTTIALGQGNVEKAEMLLVEGIEKLTKLGFPENNHNIVDFRLKLARMYSVSGYNTLAEIGFKNCLDHQKTKIVNGDLTDKTGLLYVHILFWYGVHKVRTKSFVEAKKFISNAYEYSTKIKGLSPKQEMVILYTLADVNMELGDYEIALTSMLDAIILGKGIGSIDLPMCYLKLGKIYETLNMKEKAKHFYQEARKQGELYGYGDVVTEAISNLANLPNVTDR